MAAGEFEYRILNTDTLDSHLTAVKSIICGLNDVLLSLGVNVNSFQAFEKELAELPGKYQESKGGAIIVAVDPDGEVKECGDDDRSAARSYAVPGGIACASIAVRRLDDKTCELKRLFSRPEYRGKGLGKELTVRILKLAHDKFGYTRAVLDTLDRLPAALQLYLKLGFERIPAYCYNPMPDAVYLGCPLPFATPPPKHKPTVTDSGDPCPDASPSSAAATAVASPSSDAPEDACAVADTAGDEK